MYVHFSQRGHLGAPPNLGGMMKYKEEKKKSTIGLSLNTTGEKKL